MMASGPLKIDSNALGDFFNAMKPGSPASGTGWGQAGQAGRLELDKDKVKNGLGQLVLTLVRLIHELLERQAIRRVDSGSLTEEQIEEIGTTLMMQAEEIERLRKAFNLDEEDLNIDLGPLGKLL